MRRWLFILVPTTAYLCMVYGMIVHYDSMLFGLLLPVSGGLEEYSRKWIPARPKWRKTRG